ncbi:MAG: 30S ribosomal protein S20 [Polyangiaceae bacterium]
MANHASAEKRNRQRITRTERNRAGKSAFRTELKKARVAIASKPADAAGLVKEAISTADKAASKGFIPKKRAARVKARLARALHKATQAAAAS